MKNLEKGEIGEVSGKLVIFVRSLEVVRPACFIPSGMKWCGIERKILDREKVFRAFLEQTETTRNQKKPKQF